MSLFEKLVERLHSQSEAPLERLSYGTAFRHAAATPLTNLLLNLKMIEQHRALQKSAYLREAVASADHLKKLFRLDPSDQCQDHQELFSIKLALEAAIHLVRPFQEKILIRSHLTFSNQLKLKGNRFCFQEAVICTLKNAIESYWPNQAVSNRVVLVTGRQEKLKNGKAGIKLAFIDGGCGLSWWQRPLVFADGFTTKSTGSGLGLVWVKRVIEDHLGGEVKLKSQKGKGTCLTWLIPLDNVN